MKKVLILVFILSISNLIGQNEKPWENAFKNAEMLSSDGKINSKTVSPIKIKVDDFYGLRPDENGDYHLTLNESRQTISL